MPPDRPLKVAMVTPVGLGGYLHYSHSLCGALARCGADVTFVTSAIGEDVPPGGNGLRVERFLGGMNRSQSRPLRALSYGRSLLRLHSFLKQEHFDIAHFQDTFVPFADAPFLQWLRRGDRPKTVFTAHDPDQDMIISDKGRGSRLRRSALSRIYNAADGIVAISETARDDLIAKFAIPRHKVTRIAHGNYDSYLPERMPSRDAARKRLGVERDCRLVLFFGSIKPSKGLDHLIGAFAAVAAADPQACLLIAGELRGVDPESYRAQIDSLGLGGKVLYRPGYVEPETVPDYFAASDLVALPYVRIYQSGVLHLAYSFGRPVVATRIGGFVEDVAEGRSGLLVPPGDEPALASAIGGMLASPSLLARMAEQAHQLSQTTHSWDAVGRQTLNFYESLLASKAS